MNELIKVTYENDRPTVSGRDLHEKLGISTRESAQDITIGFPAYASTALPKTKTI